MAASLEELRVLRDAETLADGIWQHVVLWESFAREVVGKQLAEAADSIGANIAEAFGRFHYAEKIHHLYYARGSLFETKYWLNRALTRELMPSAEAEKYSARLTDIARQLNAFVSKLKAQRHDDQTATKSSSLHDARAEYTVETLDPLFTEDELLWLEKSPLSNL
jgi:four helix bundle protein